MALQRYEMLSNIDSNTYDWECKLRAQTVWKGINKETNQCWGTNVVFLDDSNNRIHAFISTKHSEKLKDEPKEGAIYIVANFKVKDYIGHETYRPLRCDKHIFFTEHTTCEKSGDDGLPIQPYAFDFFALEEIEGSADDNRFLIDVVGIVQNVRPKITTNKNNVETRRLMFDITDGRTWVNVTLFNELADAYEKDVAHNEKNDLVIVISAAKIHKFDGRVNLTSFPATRVFINPNHCSVEETRLSYKTRPVMEISSDDEDETIENYNVSTLKDLGTEFLNKTIGVQVTVKRLDEKSTWYFARCVPCNVEIYKDQEKYKCSVCKRIIPHPDKRFRVLAYCTDKSGAAAIVLGDMEVRQVIQKTVFDIHAEYTEEPTIEPFPDCLKQLQHKEYTVILKLNEDNIKNGSTVYEAVGLANAPESYANFSPQKKKQLPDDMSLEKAETCEHENQTPETGNSTTLKRRGRRPSSAVPFTEESNLPTKNAKNIKIEK